MKSLNNQNFSGFRKIDYKLSDACPVAGSCNLHQVKDESIRDMHYVLELGLCKSGMERRFFVNGFAMDAGPGDIWLCGMWEPHGSKVVRTPCEVIAIKIWPCLIAQMRFPEAPDFNPMALFTIPAPERPKIPDKLKNKIIEYAVRLKEILSSETPHKTLKLRIILTEILLLLCEVSPEALSRPPSKEPRMAFSSLNRAVQLVFDSQKFVSTQDAAHVCGMNRHTFSMLFKSWMNICFADFAVKYRLSESAKQIRETQEPIKAIALQWGFADVSNFHHIFKKHYGISPHEYREHF